jgi:hypothetical protein
VASEDILMHSLFALQIRYFGLLASPFGLKTSN